MNRCLFVLLALAAGSARADTLIQATVSSVYRPLEMESRRVRSERKVFLQTTTGENFPTSAIGIEFRVTRPSLSMTTDFDYEVSVKKRASVPNSAASQTGDAPLEDGRPAGFASADRHSRGKSFEFQMDSVDLASRDRSSGSPVSALPVEQEVGRIRVLGIDGPMAIAVVVQDSLRDGEKKLPKVPKVDGSTIAVGDLAIASIKKKQKKKKARALAPAEKKSLEKAKRQLERAKRPRGKNEKYRRKRMKWDL